MKDYEHDILKDAIKTAFKAEKKVVMQKKVIIALSVLLLLSVAGRCRDWIGL